MLVIVVTLVAIIAAVLASYAYLESLKHPVNNSGSPNPRSNCSLSIVALNGTAEYSVEDCLINVKSNDTFIVLWTAIPYRVENGKLRLYVEAEKPLSMILEYAPSGSNVTGSRIVFPVKDKANITVTIVHGAVDQIFIRGNPVGHAISPYVLAPQSGENLLKITLWGPLGVDARIMLLPPKYGGKN